MKSIRKWARIIDEVLARLAFGAVVALPIFGGAGYVLTVVDAVTGKLNPNTWFLFWLTAPAGLVGSGCMLIVEWCCGHDDDWDTQILRLLVGKEDVTGGSS